MDTCSGLYFGTVCITLQTNSTATGLATPVCTVRESGGMRSPGESGIEVI